ncbi:glutathione S-transferase [Rhypophila decipiens]
MAEPTPTLTVHHLNASSSERIPWLCEELNIPYNLKIYPRDAVTRLATPEFKALHPAGSAPVINDLIASSNTSPNDEPQKITLAESGACVQYLCTKYPSPSHSDIFPSPSHPSYATFLYWFHFSNATFQAALMRSFSLQVSGIDLQTSKMGQLATTRVHRGLAMLEAQLQGNLEDQWIAGRNLFTAADIMIVFSLTTFRYWFPYSLAGYPNIVGYLGRIGKREAYQRAMGKADPGLEPALGAEAPGGLLSL